MNGLLGINLELDLPAPAPVAITGRASLYEGDCAEVLKSHADNSVDSVVTDPPYALVFMGKHWDNGDTAHAVAFWRECWRVLKPGGYLLAFGGTRTYHRLACAIEDAGFEIRDMVQWLYGSGFAKSHNLKRQPICFCNDEEAINGNEAAQRDLRSVQHPDVSEGKHSESECGEVLQHSMPERSASELRSARSQPKSSPGEQPGMEGRQLYRAGQGLSDDLEAGPSTGQSERVCAGAHSGGREDARAEPDAGRGSPSQGPQQDKQRAVESEDLREPFGALDGGALRGRGTCTRCGKLTKEFEGFGSALKPANEPICMARKPLSEPTIAANVLKWGTGAINVDGCRIEAAASDDYGRSAKNAGGTVNAHDGFEGKSFKIAERDGEYASPLGRFPANVILSVPENEYELNPFTSIEQQRELYRWLSENA